MGRRSSTISIVLALIALVLLPTISNIEANALPASWAPYLWVAWPAGLVLAAPLVFLEARQRQHERHETAKRDEALAQAQDQLDRAANALATASRNQWTAAANDRRLLHPAPLPIRWSRSTQPVAGPESAATYIRFDPLPGLTAISSGALGEHNRDALHQIYGGLPSGRMLLIGPPGSGKSAAAILLLLDALRYREQAAPHDQARIPVPVLFTLHDWRPDSGASVTDWMADKLAESYPMFRSRTERRTAADLLAAGRVAGFLDGLDEIPESVRPHVLEALADAPFRLVLLSRTAEAVDAARHRPLAGAVALELQPVKPSDAATYLLQPLVHPPPAPWQAISDRLAEEAVGQRSASALSDALTTPLALSLLRDVYGPTGPADEILDDSRFPTAGSIENHLLDQAITAAYTPRPGHPPPRYTVTTAQRTLRYLASQLTEQHTTDLVWWHIPTWTTHRSRMIRNALAGALMFGLVGGIALGFISGPLFGLSAGFGFGLAGGLAGGVRPGVPLVPRRTTRPTYRHALQGLATPGFALVLLSGLLAGPMIGLVVGLASGLSSGFMSGLSSGLVLGLMGAVISGFTRGIEVDGSSLGPAEVWRQDRNVGFGTLPVSGLVVGLISMPAADLVPRLAPALSVVLPVGLVAGLVAGMVARLGVKRVGVAASGPPGAAAVETALASVQLAIRHKIPLRLITFLEDARSRHLLRTVGPVYQFRHATLQERLTAQK